MSIINPSRKSKNNSNGNSPSLSELDMGFMKHLRKRPKTRKVQDLVDSAKSGNQYVVMTKERGSNMFIVKRYNIAKKGRSYDFSNKNLKSDPVRFSARGRAQRRFDSELDDARNENRRGK